MATNTYEVITTATVDGSTPSISITVPSGYKDLRLVANLRSGDSRSGYQSVSYRFNNDSSNSYSGTVMYGNGSTASSYRQSASVVEGLTVMNGTSTGSYFYTNILDVMSPTNGTTFTPVLIDMSNGGLGSYKQAAVYRKNDVITSIQIIEASNINWVAGSNVTLYGVGVATSAKATGGAIYSDANYMYHVFTSTGAFTPTQSLTADVLVVAGGGGGGCNMGGGGGAGGINYFASQSLSATGYTCTVGSGGAYGNNNNIPGSNGSNSQFAALTAAVGGGGGGSLQNGYDNGLSGGSGGGGAGGYDLGTGGTGGSATSGQGYAGGTGASGSNGQNLAGAGGGGAGGVGSNGSGYASSSVGGAGGVGLSTYSSWGITTGIGQFVSGLYYIAGGGGGGIHSTSTAIGVGGSGGGGSSGIYSPLTPATAGKVNSGSGGGGGTNGVDAANGGSGVVIVRYAK